MPPKTKRKQQSAKPAANQKGKESRKEAEKEVAKESATVALEAPKELGNVATLEPEEEAKPLELSEEVLQKVAEKEVTTTLEVSDELGDKTAEKEVAVVLHEVSQEVVAEKLVNLGAPEEETKHEGETEGEYLIPVAKGSSHNRSNVSEEEL
jgi:hypothetical protein